MESVETTFVEKKNVTITDNGPIMPLGGIYGPTMPQVMKVGTIATLLQKGYHVSEVLNNGTRVPLTIINYNVDLQGDGGASLKEIKKPNEHIKKIRPQQQNPVDNKSEEKVSPAPTNTEKKEEKKEENKPAEQNRTNTNYKTEQTKVEVTGEIKTTPADKKPSDVQIAVAHADDNKKNDNNGLQSNKKGNNKWGQNNKPDELESK